MNSEGVIHIWLIFKLKIMESNLADVIKLQNQGSEDYIFQIVAE